MLSSTALREGEQVTMECGDNGCPIRHHHGAVTAIYPITDTLTVVKFVDQDDAEQSAPHYVLDLYRAGAA